MRHDIPPTRTRNSTQAHAYFILISNYAIPNIESQCNVMIERLPRTWIMFPAKKITIYNITNCLFVTCKNYNVIIDLFPIDFNVFLFQHFIYIEKDWSVAETHKKMAIYRLQPTSCVYCLLREDWKSYVHSFDEEEKIYWSLHNTIF